MGERKRWVLQEYPSDATPLEIQPGHEFVLPGDNDKRLMIGAGIVLLNEGTTTAILDLPKFPIFESPLDPDTMEEDPNDDPRLLRRHSDGAYMLEPGAKTIMVLRDGPTFRELAASGGSATVSLRIVATDPARSVVDTWTIRVSARIIDPMPRDAARWRVLAWVPADVSMSTEPRQYLA